MELSIIIVSFNTKNITKKCLLYLKQNLQKYPINAEVIVVDNGSTDGSKEMLEKEKRNWKNLFLINLANNLGYTKANNIGIKKAKGKYLLFLNSDVYVEKVDFLDLINIFEAFPEIGALTVRVNLVNSEIDPASHRGIPTLWRSFCYFVKLEKLTKNIPVLNRIFGGYHLTHLDLNKIHEVEAISGAFFLTRKMIIKKIGGFDEDYFAYGEDLELCYQIKKMGYKILYYPLWQVTHLKSVSGFKKTKIETRLNTNYYFFEAMRIFYQKHYQKKYPFVVNLLVNWVIDRKQKIYQKKLTTTNHAQLL